MKLRKACEDSADNLQGRPFPVESVDIDRRVMMEVEHTYIALSDYQYCARFGGAHRQKDPKCPQIWIQNLAGEQELVWLFREEDVQYRRVRLKSVVADAKMTQVQCASDHLHPEQGHMVYKHSIQQRHGSSNIQEVLSRNPCLSTLDEYMLKLERRKNAETEEDFGQQQKMEEADTDSDADASGQNWVKSMQDFHTPVAAEKQSKKRKEGQQQSWSRPPHATRASRSKSAASLGDGVDEEVVDDDGAATAISRVASQASARRAGNAEEETAEKWIDKLKLNDVLAGRKLGVVLRHAEAATGKMNVKEKLQTQAHLRLVSCCITLSPDVIQTKNAEQIQEALEELHPQDVRYPESLQVHLFRKEVQELQVAYLSTLDRAKVTDLWTCLRPACFENEEMKMDLRRPCLSTLSLSLEERVDMWLDHLITNCLLPLMMEGEKKSQTVAIVAKTFLDLIYEDMLKDLPDLAVPAYVELQAGLRAIKGLVSEDWATIMECSDEVKNMKKPGEHKKVFPHLWNGVQTVEWYKSRHADYTKQLRTLELHGPEIEELETFYTKNETDDKGYLKELLVRLGELPSLMKELPDKPMASMSGRMNSIVKNVWGQMKQHLQSQESDCDVGAMQQILAESAIIWEMDEDFVQAQRVLADHLVNESGKGRCVKAMEAMEACKSFFFPEAEVEEMKVDVVHLALEAFANAKGCTFLEEQLVVLGPFWGQLSDEVLKLLESESRLELLGPTVDLLAEICKSMPEDQVRGGRLSKIKGLLKMVQDVQKFKALGADMETRCQAEDAKTCLASLTRDVALSEEWGPLDGWGASLQDRLVKEAEEINKKCSQSMQANKLKILTDYLARAKVVAGGRSDSTSWDAGLGSGATFEMVMGRAKETILTLEAEEITAVDALRSSLMEASNRWTQDRH